MINFPSSPTLDQEYSFGNRVWKYNGTGWELKIDAVALTPGDISGALGYLPVDPDDLATVATSGVYADLTGKPILGTAAATAITDYATASQGTKADTAIQTLTSTDGSVAFTTTGTLRDLSVTVAGATNNVIAQVRNITGATLTKGTAVYISGATGQISTVSKALATSDATSAQTLGLITADLANNSNGNVTVIGLITNINTSAYTDGQQLYLSPTTAGALTATKPYAPNHMVYVAVVEHSHPTQGKLFVKVQNGYELDEIHDVAITSAANNDSLYYNSATGLWENKTPTLARTALGLGTAATTNSTAYATATQGTTADAALPRAGGTMTGAISFAAGQTWPTFNQSTTGNAATATSVSGGTASVTTLTASADSAFTSTGAVQLSSGTTAQRPTGAAGKLRFNSTTNEFEGHNGTVWSSVGGSAISNDTSTATQLYPLFANATTGTAANVYTSNAQYLFQPSTGTLSAKAVRSSNGITINSSTVTSDYTIATGDNGLSSGPVTINSGVTVTVSTGSVWTVV